ncbi:MAG: hypothetical protein JWR51_2170 [Devosia sp.]|uniref:hypothetical protein n=1 Tax=Devosia sp. TaxID=1871048 RepID=UPI00262AB06C|nr:hypothetical protein [Devosia sp.]MDB5529067.1 hypothetical protein [Devosia sp.]
MASAQITATQQARQSGTFAGLKMLNDALAKAKFAQQSQSGGVKYVDNIMKVPKYKTLITYETEAIMTEVPVYEGRQAAKSVADGTRLLSSFREAGQAGIDIGATFQVRVGSGASTSISFGTGRTISVTSGSSTTKYTYGGAEGEFASTLTKILDGLPGLQAKMDGGQLKLETEKSESLTLTDSLLSPLGALGLTAGTFELNGTGLEQVQIGTRMAQTGTKQVEVSRAYQRNGDREIITGTHAVQEKVDEKDAALTSASRKAILTAALALDNAIGPAEISKGVANPYDQIRGQIGMAQLKTATTRGDLGYSAAQVAMMVQAYAKQMAAASGTNKLG